MSNNKTDETVSLSAFDELREKNERLEALLASHKRSTPPLVGVRWFGYGPYLISSTIPIAGAQKVTLKGLGDKTVIDVNAWNKLRETPQRAEIKFGILVRDDDVIVEKHLTSAGEIAPPDQGPKNPNAFTDKEVQKLLISSEKVFNKAVSELTAYQAVVRIRHAATKFNIGDEAKISLLRRRYDELLKKFQYMQMNPYDLIGAAEKFGVAIDHLNPLKNKKHREEIAETLTKVELNAVDAQDGNFI